LVSFSLTAEVIASTYAKKHKPPSIDRRSTRSWGPFSLFEPGRNHSMLQTAGFADVEVEEIEMKPIPYFIEGAAVAEASYTPFVSTVGKKKAKAVRLIVRRVPPTPGSQLALYVEYSYHAFITDRTGDMLALEADHRRHAEVEATIRDLKYGVGLNHLPSGRFGANGAWLAFNAMAHNLIRWSAAIGLADAEAMTTKTFRRRLVTIPGRLARSGRRTTLHLPQRWPWEGQFLGALAALRAVQLAT